VKIVFLIAALGLSHLSLAQTTLSYIDYFKFSQIPVLHAGRIKPLSTFAREHLLLFYGKPSLPNQSAEEWLLETLVNPDLSLKRSIFKIQNPEVIDILDLPHNKTQTYSFQVLSHSLDKMIKTLNEIQLKDKESRDRTEQQILDLYLKSHHFFKLHRSLFMMLPLFVINSPDQAKAIGIKPNQKYSLTQMLKFQQKIQAQIAQLKPIHFKSLSTNQKQLILMSFRMNHLLNNTDNSLFKIIPPQWENDKELWGSPWDLIRQSKGSPQSALYIKSWNQIIQFYYQKHKSTVLEDSTTQTHLTHLNLKTVLDRTYKQSIQISKKWITPSGLFIEKIFNDIQFFNKSLILYLLSFIFLLISFLFQPKIKSLLQKYVFIALAVGFALHFIGILLRIFIMKRPPVSNLYESILFVGLIIVGAALFLEKYHKPKIPNAHLKTGLGLLMGSVVVSMLHLISFKHKGIESMSLLVPVLNTNFWLATHVICITIGYACAIIASFMGHMYVFFKIFYTSSTVFAKDLYHNIRRTVFIALFFCVFGTILGGIWADQSWGRFLGWDPKENRALGIIIWLLVLIHGHLSRLLKDTLFAIGAMLTSVIVALSWFGVNLLSVGLHSYGFTQGILWGLIVFCGVEWVLAMGAAFYLKYKH